MHGADPQAALFQYSRDRRGDHLHVHLASWPNMLKADAYGGYSEVSAAGRQHTPVLEASCFAHARRKSFELAYIRSQ